MNEQASIARPAAPVPTHPPRPAPDDSPELPLRDDMIALSRRVDALLPRPDHRVLLFTSAVRGEGVSTIVRAYARTLAEALGRSVLLVDADARSAAQRAHLAASAEPDRADVPVGGGPVERAILATSHPNLSVTRCAGAPERASLEPLVADLRERFDAVLIDAGPVAGADAVAFAASADGVVLVVEADRTRWPVALRAKEAIVEGGGSVLGVVLNKRRLYIPEPVYRRL